ncbi:hypothetical protein T484DRAFT_1778212, partial [Baffinella frigidus]
ADHIQQVLDNCRTFTDFLKEGLIEYLDVNEENDCMIAFDGENDCMIAMYEENDCMIALYESGVRRNTTHLEIDPLTVRNTTHLEIDPLTVRNTTHLEIDPLT